MRGRRERRKGEIQENPDETERKRDNLIKPSFLGESATIISAASVRPPSSVGRIDCHLSARNRKSQVDEDDPRDDGCKINGALILILKAREERHARFRAIWIPRILSGTQFIAFSVPRPKDIKVFFYISCRM